MTQQDNDINRSKPIPRGIPTVRMMAMPADTNWLGDIFGGWLMSQADIAGAVLAYRRTGGNVVTIAVNNFLFIEPVYIGDIVSFYAEIERVGNTSITTKRKFHHLNKFTIYHPGTPAIIPELNIININAL